jgi:hypothetical protein
VQPFGFSNFAFLFTLLTFGWCCAHPQSGASPPVMPHCPSVSFLLRLCACSAHTIPRRSSFLSPTHNIPGRFEFSQGFWVVRPPSAEARPRESVAEDAPDTPATVDEQGIESPSRSPPASTPPPPRQGIRAHQFPDNTPVNAPSPPSARPPRGALTLLNPEGNLPVGAANLLRSASYCYCNPQAWTGTSPLPDQCVKHLVDHGVLRVIPLADPQQDSAIE